MACFCSAATSQRRALRSTTPSPDVAAILWRCRCTRASTWRSGGEEGNDHVQHKLPPVRGRGSRDQPVVAGAAAGPARAGGGGRRCHKMAVLCAALLGRRGKRPRGSKAALRRPRRHWLCAPRGPPGAERARRAGSGRLPLLPPLPLSCRAWARTACV